MNNNLESFRGQIDTDTGLLSKRKILVAMSVVLIVLNCSGATLQEVNTFIFKIKFTNHNGLVYFLSLSVAFLTLRYYGYAQVYHEKLFHFWSQRMLNDYKVFYSNPMEDYIGGLLAKRIDVSPISAPGIQSPNYKVVGLFKRNLVYTVFGPDEYGNDSEYDKNIPLNKYTDKWKLTDYFKLLIFEAHYQLEAFLKHREYLDILYPYILSTLALLTVVFKDIFI